MRAWYLLVGLLVSVAVALTGCGGSSSDSNARVQMLVGDAPLRLVGGSTVTAVNVHIKKVELLREADNDATRVTLFDGSADPAPFDLLSLANTSLTTLPKLATTSIPAGHYTQMRIILAEGSTVTLSDGSQHDLTVASGPQTGFKVAVNLDFAAGTFESILLDFNLSRLALVGNGFHLTPQALRVVKISQTGAITGTVTLPDGVTLTDDLQLTFTLVDSQGLPVNDANGNAIATQLSWPAATTTAATTGTFTLNGVPSGMYAIQVAATYGAQTLTIDPIPVTVTSGANTAVTLDVPGLVPQPE